MSAGLPEVIRESFSDECIVNLRSQKGKI